MVGAQQAVEEPARKWLASGADGDPIPWDAQQVHRISDQDVSQCPPFKKIAEEVESTLVDSRVVGHNVRFDTGFIAMELQQADCSQVPLGCLDTCRE